MLSFITIFPHNCKDLTQHLFYSVDIGKSKDDANQVTDCGWEIWKRGECEDYDKTRCCCFIAYYIRTQLHTTTKTLYSTLLSPEAIGISSSDTLPL